MLAQETIIAFNHACSRPFLLSAFFVWVGIAVDLKTDFNSYVHK